MATTPNYALPYPLPSAPVANGAADIQALADRLDSVVLPGHVSDTELTTILTGYATDAELAAVAATAAAAIAKAIVDAKGDLIAATGADAVARLAVGTDGQVLTADSAQAAGMRWATASGGGGGAPSIGTTLPGSPADGQEAVLVDSLTAPTYAWSFRYVAGITDAYKWLFVGGAPLIVEIATSETTASTTYTALTTAGPVWTPARAGIYDVALAFNSGSSGTASGLMSYDIGATGAVDLDSAGVYQAAPQGGMMAFRRKTLAASVALTAKYKTSAGTQSFANRRIVVHPLRIS